MARIDELAVEIVSPLSGERLFDFHLPRQSEVLQVKRHILSVSRIGVFQQRVFLASTHRLLEDGEALSTLLGVRTRWLPRTWPAGARQPAAADVDARPRVLVLELVRLAHVDADATAGLELLYAAARGHISDLRRLLELRIHPDYHQQEQEDGMPEGSTALMLAVYHGHVKAVRLLLDAGSDMDRPMRNGATPLTLATANDSLEACTQAEMVRALCSAGADKDRMASNGATALTLASSTGRLAVVRALCRARADANKAIPCQCSKHVIAPAATALTLASQNGHAAVVRVLCKAGADKDQVMCSGATALVYASANGHAAVARVLCEGGADKDRVMYNGATALISASANGHAAVVRMLCHAGANTDQAMYNGATALCLASRYGHAEVVRVLCDARADVHKVR